MRWRFCQRIERRLDGPCFPLGDALLDKAQRILPLPAALLRLRDFHGALRAESEASLLLSSIIYVRSLPTASPIRCTALARLPIELA